MGRTTWDEVFQSVANYYSSKPEKPFSHVIVDESQDLSVTQLRMLSAIFADSANCLFFAGDIGQRIFQEPFSWKSHGIDIRGRSSTLKVNYRTGALSSWRRKNADSECGPALRRQSASSASEQRIEWASTDYFKLTVEKSVSSFGGFLFVWR
ncbi:MAG: UvrD-helicase domain-containing protein [Rhodobacterales bacterium]|nr:UvrD-helicase domain-containing protein [Rhodobacterales bacterium]